MWAFYMFYYKCITAVTLHPFTVCTCCLQQPPFSFHLLSPATYVVALFLRASRYGSNLRISNSGNANVKCRSFSVACCGCESGNRGEESRYRGKAKYIYIYIYMCVCVCVCVCVYALPAKLNMKFREPC